MASSIGLKLRTELKSVKSGKLLQWFIAVSPVNGNVTWLVFCRLWHQLNGDAGKVTNGLWEIGYKQTGRQRGRLRRYSRSPATKLWRRKRAAPLDLSNNIVPPHTSTPECRRVGSIYMSGRRWLVGSWRFLGAVRTRATTPASFPQTSEPQEVYLVFTTLGF